VSIDVGELEILIVRPALHDATVQEPCRTICLAPCEAYSGVTASIHGFEPERWKTQFGIRRFIRWEIIERKAK
jgi:hypothetical protein